MNKVLVVLILAIGFLSCNTEADKNEEKSTTNQTDVKTLEAEGFNLFQENPGKAIAIFQEVSSKYIEEKNYIKAGLTNLNIANIYDEYLSKPDSALYFSKKSLSIWKSIDDTLQQANLYKYIGLLKGKLGDYKSAKKDIHQAIKFYESVPFEQGIAVSQFNLANVYFEEGNKEESISLHEKALAFWKAQDDKNRIFTNNLFGIELYAKYGEEKKVEALIKENQDLAKSISLNDFLKNRFEELVKKYGR